MKKFFSEFKKFITRGNVLDLSVGVIVGSAFTAVVNALSNNILNPIINWILYLVLGTDSLSEMYTFLNRVNDENGIANLSESIYIDWGAFITSIINFLLIAMVLFCIVRFMNKLNSTGENVFHESKVGRERRKAIRKLRKTEGLTKEDATAKFEAEENAKKAEAEAKKEEEERLKKEEEANKVTAEKLLAEIRDLLADKKN